MNTFLKYLTDSQMIKSINLTLLHSLWQGAIISIIAGIIIVTTKKTNPAVRYKLLLATLILFVVSAAFTFLQQLNSSADNNSTNTVFTVLSEGINYHYVVKNTNTNYGHQILGFLNAHATTIVTVWFIIILFKSIQLLIGLHGTYNLKKQQIFPVNKSLEERLQVLALNLGIYKYIRLLQSKLVQVPLTIGYFKPVILIPFGLITAIPNRQQVELYKCINIFWRSSVSVTKICSRSKRFQQSFNKPCKAAC